MNTNNLVITSLKVSCDNKPKCRPIPSSSLNLLDCGNIKASYLHVEYICALNNSSITTLPTTITVQTTTTPSTTTTVEQTSTTITTTIEEMTTTIATTAEVTTTAESTTTTAEVTTTTEAPTTTAEEMTTTMTTTSNETDYPTDTTSTTTELSTTGSDNMTTEFTESITTTTYETTSLTVVSTMTKPTSTTPFTTDLQNMTTTLLTSSETPLITFTKPTTTSPSADIPIFSCKFDDYDGKSFCGKALNITATSNSFVNITENIKINNSPYRINDWTSFNSLTKLNQTCIIPFVFNSLEYNYCAYRLNNFQCLVKLPDFYANCNMGI